MKQIVSLVSILALAGVLSLVGLTGCEKEPNAVVITIVPNPVAVTVSNSAVMLTATGGLRALSLPLSWSVSNPIVGNIDPAYRGEVAVYVSTDSNGVNLVTVIDQYGAEGHATITHNYATITNGEPGTVLALFANPGRIDVGQNTSYITMDTNIYSRPPYSWRVGDPTYGGLSYSTTYDKGATNIYTSVRTGINTIYVTDIDGRRGQINVEQQ